MAIEVQELYGYLIQDPVVEPALASFVQEHRSYMITGANATSQGNLVNRVLVANMHSLAISGKPAGGRTAVKLFKAATIQGPPPAAAMAVKTIRGYIIDTE